MIKKYHFCVFNTNLKMKISYVIYQIDRRPSEICNGKITELVQYMETHLSPNHIDSDILALFLYAFDR